MSIAKIKFSLITVILAFAAVALAEDDPAHERHEMMEGVRDAAKPVGQMMQGKIDYDADQVMTSLGVFNDAAMRVGGLFPAGSESGSGEHSRAAPAVWEDREGFDAAIVEWQEAIKVAMDAEPATLDAGKPVLGPIFGACKNCHDSYRIEDE